MKAIILETWLGILKWPESEDSKQQEFEGRNKIGHHHW